MGSDDGTLGRDTEHACPVTHVGKGKGAGEDY